jgi:signal transduction histidine kinase
MSANARRTSMSADAGLTPMSVRTGAHRLALEGAERRVMANLRSYDEPPSLARQIGVLAGAAALFAATFAARLLIDDPPALIANFYVLPVAILAIEFGTLAGVLGAAVAVGLVFAWGAIETVHVGVLGYVSRGAVVLITGVLVGGFSERVRRDIAERRQSGRDLSLYADELERANVQLARSVDRLEAFAEIARAVGGETDLERVLSLILAHGRDIVAARRLVVCLPEGDELVALTGEDLGRGPELRLPINDSVAGEVMLLDRPVRATAADNGRGLEQLAPGASSAILVPLIFRGETLGVLAGIDRLDGRPFEEEDEQLLLSVAASAATAIATARSVAAARLRLSLEAAEEARGRWARELHDETLQGLTGIRMVLAAGLARQDLSALRTAAETADVHVGEEMHKLRDLIAELRPAALDDLGLGPAIESLANRQAEIGGFSISLGLELHADQRIEPDTESTIYRIMQESLSNVVKHAVASQVTVSVRQLPRSVEIEVRDDGHGFEPGRAVEGFGITGMRERATLAGGRLSVTSGEGQPTCVSAVLPLPS